MRSPHTTFQKGKRLLVILRNGESFVATYNQKTDNDREILFFDHPPVKVKKLRALTIYRAQPR